MSEQVKTVVLETNASPKLHFLKSYPPLDNLVDKGRTVSAPTPASQQKYSNLEPRSKSAPSPVNQLKKSNLESRSKSVSSQICHLKSSKLDTITESSPNPLSQHNTPMPKLRKLSRTISSGPEPEFNSIFETSFKKFSLEPYIALPIAPSLQDIKRSRSLSSLKRSPSSTNLSSLKRSSSTSNLSSLR